MAEQASDKPKITHSVIHEEYLLNMLKLDVDMPKLNMHNNMLGKPVAIAIKEGNESVGIGLGRKGLTPENEIIIDRIKLPNGEIKKLDKASVISIDDEIDSKNAPSKIIVNNDDIKKFSDVAIETAKKQNPKTEKTTTDKVMELAKDAATVALPVASAAATVMTQNIPSGKTSGKFMK